MKRYILSTAALMISLAAWSQNEYDALRYSQQYIQGTSRSAAMGGAFGALGGDLSVLTINPAGMSIYGNGEMSITPVFGQTSTQNRLGSQTMEDDKYSFRLSNFGYVAASDHSGNLTNLAFGITFNRMNDYCLNNRIQGISTNGSMLDYWCESANGNYYNDLNAFGNKLAASTYAIEPVSDESPTTWCNPHTQAYNEEGNFYGQTQNKSTTAKGGINSWDFALSASFLDKFYIGASLALQTLNYKYNSQYAEDDKTDVVNYEHFDYEENLKTNGTGVNFKLGMIYKPINFLKFGAAIHTPTFYDLTDKYYSALDITWDEYSDGSNTGSAVSDDNEFNYKLYSPFKTVLSGAFIIPNHGLISMDYEYDNYSGMRFESGDDDYYAFTSENDAIKQKFQATHNFRFGAEYLLGIIRLRAGYAIYGNPVKEISDNIQRTIYSGGVGFQGDEWYLDIAATYHDYKTIEYLYKGNEYQRAYTVNNNYLYVMATLGLRF